jgi:hypothetical protein
MKKFLLISSMALSLFGYSHSTSTNSNDKIIFEYQKSISKDLPAKFGQKSMLVAIFNEQSSLHLKMFLDNRDMKELTPKAIEHFIFKSDIPTICNGPKEKELMSKGIFFILDYYDYDGNSLFKYVVEEANCTGSKPIKRQQEVILSDLGVSAEASVKFYVDRVKDRLPMRLDNVTELFDIKADGKNMTIYKSVDIKHNDIKNFPIDFLRDYVYKVEKNMACNTKSNKSLLDMGVKISYKYLSKDEKKPLFDYSFTKDDCR